MAYNDLSEIVKERPRTKLPRDVKEPKRRTDREDLPEELDWEVGEDYDEEEQRRKRKKHRQRREREDD